MMFTSIHAYSVWLTSRWSFQCLSNCFSIHNYSLYTIPLSFNLWQQNVHLKLSKQYLYLGYKWRHFIAVELVWVFTVDIDSHLVILWSDKSYWRLKHLALSNNSVAWVLVVSGWWFFMQKVRSRSTSLSESPAMLAITPALRKMTIYSNDCIIHCTMATCNT